MEPDIEKELEICGTTYHLQKLGEQFTEKNINPASAPLDLFTDAILIVDRNRIYCHKAILGMYSDVFKAMFMSNMKESISGEVQLKEDLETVKNLLSFMYNGKIDKDKVNVPLLVAADKYEILVLKRICTQLLPKMIKSENVVEIYQAGILLDIKDLIDTTTTYMVENWDTLSKQNDVKEFCKKYPDFVFEVSTRLAAQVDSQKEKNEAHLYMTLKFIMEESFYVHHGMDLMNQKNIQGSLELKVKKECTLKSLLNLISTKVKKPLEALRIWPFCFRQNETYRPSYLDIENNLNKSISRILKDNIMTLTVFLEIAPENSPRSSLPSFDKDKDVMLFFKLYDYAQEKTYYMGHMYVAITSKVSAMVPELISRANLNPGTDLSLYEEIKPNMLEKIGNINNSLERELDELMDGDIIVFQKDLDPNRRMTEYRFPTAPDYFENLYLNKL